MRAAAVSALARADSVHRRAIIAEGLGLPSYQESIRVAALGALVQTNDTSLIDQVEGLLNQLRTAARALAALANRGSVRALDVLTRHLDDERPYVRRSVLQAFQLSVRPDLARARLRAVQEKLKYPDARRTAASLLQQLEQRQPGE